MDHPGGFEIQLDKCPSRRHTQERKGRGDHGGGDWRDVARGQESRGGPWMGPPGAGRGRTDFPSQLLQGEWLADPLMVDSGLQSCETKHFCCFEPPSLGCVSCTLPCTSVCPSQGLVWPASAKSLQLCPTLCNPMDCSPPGFFQASILEWVAMPSSSGSSPPRDGTCIYHICSTGRFFTTSTTWEAPSTQQKTHGTKLQRPMDWHQPKSWTK